MGVFGIRDVSMPSDESIGKALVVCPVSLVDNWKKEFRKW